MKNEIKWFFSAHGCIVIKILVVLVTAFIGGWLLYGLTGIRIATGVAMCGIALCTLRSYWQELLESY